jgi:protein-disulfide isomerase
VSELTDQARAKRRLIVAGAVVLAAIVAVAVVIAAGSGKDSGPGTSAGSGPAASGTSGLKGAKAVSAEFAGIPQKGNQLGSASAKATMMVFADMQCPFCAEFENTAMPELVRRYVRPGKLRIVFQPIAILGNDSVLGARAVAAAAQQGKLFEFTATLYRNQGPENTGYLTRDYVKKVAAAVPGLDAAKLIADLSSPAAGKLVSSAQATATSGKVDSTPTFFAARSGTTLAPLQVSELTAAAFTPALDQLTG